MQYDYIPERDVEIGGNVFDKEENDNVNKKLKEIKELYEENTKKLEELEWYSRKLIDLFERYLMEKVKLRVAELFSGVGMFIRGIENSDCFEPELVATSEIDIDAIVSYTAIHHGLTEEMVDSYEGYPPMAEMRAYLTDLNIGYSPEKDKPYNWMKSGKAFERKVKKTWLACMLSKNYGDISRIERLPKADIWSWSSPCQSISVSGKLEGLNPDDNTRSSLIWQILRLLKAARENNTLPDYMILENVKNLVGKRFIDDFNRLNKIIEDEFDYSVRYSVINAKDCGVPQNRERVFAMYIKKDIDNGAFTFPQPFDTGIRLKDVLQDEVDESYYVNTEKAEALIKQLVDDGKIDVEQYVKECL